MKIGVLGGGQLARMLALAGHPLGLECVCYDPSPTAGAGRVTELSVGAFDDIEAIDRWARSVDLVTYEWENVPAELAGHLASSNDVLPNPRALATAQDRFYEKRIFTELDIPVPPFRYASNKEELLAACRDLGAPLVVKARTGGYDGKSQVRLRQGDNAALNEAIDLASHRGVVVEQFIDFRFEVSVIGVRARNGDVAIYPVTQNEHRDGILHTSIAPADVDADLARSAQQYLHALLRKMEYIGVLTLELFVTDAGLLANEMAPRVHNSGHWTIEGAATSQFENHLRAIGNLPLGSTELVQPSAMVNFVGKIPRSADVLAIEGAHLHLYAKQPRPGRKVGHATVTAPHTAALRERLEALQAIVDAS